ncbi:MAG: hypothetical protein UT05_C0006G0016 [Parcubacteria group bacterium GW2011_GWF2_38_76]|nr:MAG: hypothetical protein UT05_C0006G0016 [Parcubacteria group bacterium GW2011_GWF2_38_76]
MYWLLKIYFNITLDWSTESSSTPVDGHGSVKTPRLAMTAGEVVKLLINCFKIL